ncbi:MAG: DUF5615 family PIN-like protein [Bacteroidia bacterium]|nr:DUF5615 family PIN-like protein [Bacteroidia bacterium]
MKFIVDTQLPPRLAHYLTSKGYDSVHTTFYEDGHLLKDKEIIVIAKNEDRTVATKNADFFDNYFIKGSPPKVLLIEFGNINNNDLIQLFEENLEKVMLMFQEGSNLVLFRRDEVIGY